MEIQQFEEAIRKEDFAIGDSLWINGWEFEVVNRKRCDKSSGVSQSYSNDCKEVDKKMDENTKEKLENYLELFHEIKEKTQDERVAANLLTEIAKDRRMEQIRQERSFNGDVPATEKQIAFLRDFGVAIPVGLTKRQASNLIENARASVQVMDKAGKMPIRVP